MTTEGNAALHHGSTARPEGEKVVEHGSRKREEASSTTLANHQDSSEPDSSASPAREDGGRSCVASDGQVEIARATTRFAIDLAALSAESNLSRKKGDKRVLSADEKAARDVLDDVSRLATTARNAGMRSIFRQDADRLDAYLAEHGQMPTKSEDWATKSYSYPIMRLAAPRLSSSITATLQHDVDRDWRRWRFDVLIRQTRSAPHFRMGQPIPIPKSVVKFRVEGDRGFVTAALYSEAHQGDRRFCLPIVARDAHQKMILDKLASGQWRHGEVNLERDRLRPGRWYLRISYKRLVPVRTEGITAAINRGIRCFLVAATSSGETWIYDANDIEAYLKQIQRRRKQYQYDSKASGRDGHGRKRILQPTERLTGKAERWRKNRCQVIARRLARWLAERNVSLVYIEDFEGIRDGLPERLEGGQYIWERIQEWPYYQLGMRLIACLSEYGIRTETRPVAFHSQRCPRCGNTCAENRDLRHWVLRCVQCKYKRHLDVAHCLNSLASGQATPGSGSNENGSLRGGARGSRGAARNAARKASKGGVGSDRGGNG